MALTACDAVHMEGAVFRANGQMGCVLCPNRLNHRYGHVRGDLHHRVPSLIAGLKVQAGGRGPGWNTS